MGVHSDTKMTSAEIAHLWTTYMSNSAAVCFLRHCVHWADDPEIRQIGEVALRESERHVKDTRAIFEAEQFPVPHGFSDDDVNERAPRLFSDTLLLKYIRNMGNVGSKIYSDAFTVSARSEIRSMYKANIESSVQLANEVDKLLLQKGLNVRAPFIPYPMQVEYVHKEGFLRGYFGDKRPLASMEISNLFMNMIFCTVAKTLLTGFSQVAQSEEAVRYLARGREIHEQHLKSFADTLQDNDLPVSMPWDAAVMDSRVPPFSDKLMLFHAGSLFAAAIVNYSTAATTSIRRDIPTMFFKMVAELVTYGDDGAELMVKKGWLEKMPCAADHEALVQV